MGIKIQNIILSFLSVGIVGLTIAYANLSQELKINSTAKISTWGIEFKNLKQSQKVGNTTVVAEPSIQAGAHTISGLDVTFGSTRSKIVYTFDIENTGTMDATVASYELGTPICTDSTGSTTSADATKVCNNLVYTLTDSEGNSITTGQDLNKGDIKNMVMTIAFDENGTSDDLNITGDVVISGLTATINYQQK